MAETVLEKLTTAADLTYNIATKHLSGAIDGVSIGASAGAGGRAQSKTAGALDRWLANNPFATAVKLPADKSHPGGPLPMGKYRIVLHESRTNWLRLLPLDPTRMLGRDNMAIHGSGPRGSDGCIVPTDFAVVKLLVKLVAERKERNAPDVTLEVVAVGQELDKQVRTA